MARAWVSGEENDATSCRQKPGGGGKGAVSRRLASAAITSRAESWISRPERCGTPDTVVVANRSHHPPSVSTAAAARVATAGGPSSAACRHTAA